LYQILPGFYPAGFTAISRLRAFEAVLVLLLFYYILPIFYQPVPDSANILPGFYFAGFTAIPRLGAF
jgi:hypothetical protein